MSLVLASLAACSTAPTPSGGPGSSDGPGSSGSPTGGPTSQPTAPSGGIDHPTGAKDVVLRFEEGGGLMAVEQSLTYAPSFTLYGDGTVVFRDPWAIPPETGNNVRLGVPFMVVRLDEGGIQALLEEALVAGRLAIAAGPYGGAGADIPTATFTIAVDGATKQVSVTGLSPDVHPGPDQAIVAALAAFAERLRLFADVVANEQRFVPTGYLGTLIQADQAFGPVLAWPWPELSPDDFGGDHELFRTRDLSTAEVEALGISGLEGGMSGITLDHDGKLFSFALRPLLPEELR